jgi:hypothetical protein
MLAATERFPPSRLSLSFLTTSLRPQNEVVNCDLSLRALVPPDFGLI